MVPGISTFLSLALAFSTAVAQDLFVPASPAGANNLYCDACTMIGGYFEKHGCDMACDQFGPPVSYLCSWMRSQNYTCEWLVKKLTGGSSPESACTELGLCGTACECGVCTKEVAGPEGRCLGMPYDCQHQTATLRALRGSAAQSSEEFEGNSSSAQSNSCVGAQCDGTEANFGCCLTCF
eukprot:TRINITY_DN40254_c0_g1_i1.p1 TRINITY_DN40254_c0_g1~~TRINITY_DN40254_c0_g1_i1.p1  ORF type:complete len:180 (+),score=25.24 TRINITY_DN40254_c0_g1_i1:78-617(+)